VKDCQVTEEMDAAVELQGQVENNNWKLERGLGEEGYELPQINWR
jgi:hypothetical protein